MSKKTKEHESSDLDEKIMKNMQKVADHGLLEEFLMLLIDETLSNIEQTNEDKNDHDKKEIMQLALLDIIKLANKVSKERLDLSNFDPMDIYRR